MPLHNTIKNNGYLSYNETGVRLKLERIVKSISAYSNILADKSSAFKLIDDKTLRKEILPFANNNTHIIAAQFLFLFYTEDGLPNTQSRDTNFIVNVQNTYQSAAICVRAAINEGFDAHLIEGLHYKEIDKILQFEKSGLRSVAFVACK